MNRHKSSKKPQALDAFHLNELLNELPGGSVVKEGLDNLAKKQNTIPAQLLLVGGPRLRSLGLNIPSPPDPPEHLLYHLLWTSDPNAAHSRYNALIRLLVSFERAAECVVSSRKINSKHS